MSMEVNAVQPPPPPHKRTTYTSIFAPPSPVNGVVGLSPMPDDMESWSCDDDDSFDASLTPLIHALAASAIRRENMPAKQPFAG
jgi:hypothetical protein